MVARGLVNSQLPIPNSQRAEAPGGNGIPPATNMSRSEWEPSKPFDLRERFLEFACLIVKLVQFLHTRGPIAIELSYQVLKSGTSAGANYEEADDGNSDRDTLAKRKIVLRELKETRFRLKVLHRSKFIWSDTSLSS
jgi:four helix bundle protein